jgi:hypothetical protein
VEKILTKIVGLGLVAIKAKPTDFGSSTDGVNSGSANIPRTGVLYVGQYKFPRNATTV